MLGCFHAGRAIPVGGVARFPYRPFVGVFDMGNDTMIRNQTLEDIGRALYGRSSWRPPLAEALHITLRTLRRWVNNTQDMPPGAWADVAELVTRRTEQLQKLLEAVVVERYRSEGTTDGR